MRSNKSKSLKYLLAMSVALPPLMATTVVAAHAEETASRQSAMPDEITVSARRRDESLQEVPVAMTAVSAEMLEDAGAIDITSIQRMTPNATIEVARGSNSTLIAFIRGVGQQDPLWGFEPGVGVYVDDVYIARPQGSVLDIFDVERVEVLRGPQGTLYGRNTVGGAIKYVTKKLNMDEPEGKVQANYGSYSQFDQVLVGSTPLSDTFAIGGAVANYQRDGFGTNLLTGAEHYDKDVKAFRLSAEWQATPDVFIRLAGDLTRDDSNAKHGHRLLPSADDSIQVTKDIYDTWGGIGDDNKVRTKGYSLTVAWDMSENVTIKSITAYRDGETETPIDFDALPQQDFDVPATYEDDQFSQEFQFLYEGEKVSGVAGIYYLDGNASGDFDVILSALGLTIYQAGDQNKKNISIYGDFSYQATDKLEISLGGRYTEDDTTADVLREVWLGLGSGSFDSANDTSVYLGDQTNYKDLSRKDNQFSPRVSVNYAASDNLNLYASYSEGFKAGGFDPRAREDLDPLGLTKAGFGPETVKTYEIGAKGTIFNDRLTFASAIFFSDYSDQQITVQTAVDTDDDMINDTFVSSVFNAGKSEYKGFEFEGALNVTDNFTLTGVLGYIDAEITEILSAGVNVADSFVTQNTPEWTGRIGGSYVTELANEGGSLTFNASASYRDQYNLFNVDNEGHKTDPALPVGTTPLDPDAYWLYDASIIWNSGGAWKVGLYGRNLSDEEYRVAGYNFAGSSLLGADGAYSAFYGAPRTFTLSVGYSF